MFEHLGWMILAKEYGYKDKTYTYKNSLQRLKEMIEKRHKSLKDPDIKKDFEIMKNNLQVLIDHVSKDEL